MSGERHGMHNCPCCGFRYYDWNHYYKVCRWCRANAEGFKCRPGTGGHPHTALNLEDVT